jgi:hypothetical protein
MLYTLARQEAAGVNMVVKDGLNGMEAPESSTGVTVDA